MRYKFSKKNWKFHWIIRWSIKCPLLNNEHQDCETVEKNITDYFQIYEDQK